MCRVSRRRAAIALVFVGAAVAGRSFRSGGAEAVADTLFDNLKNSAAAQPGRPEPARVA